MIYSKKYSKYVEIEIERRLTTKGLGMLSPVSIGDEIPVILNGVVVTNVLVHDKYIFENTPTKSGILATFNFACYEDSASDFLHNQINAKSLTVSFLVHDNKISLRLEPKLNYKPSDLELPYGELIKLSDRYLESSDYDHKVSFRDLVKKATIGACAFYLGEWRLLLGFEGSLDFTEFKLDSSGWSYHSDCGSILNSASDMEIDTVESTITKVIDRVTKLTYNP